MQQIKQQLTLHHLGNCSLASIARWRCPPTTLLKIIMAIINNCT
jgi:hypothetical protein